MRVVYDSVGKDTWDGSLDCLRPLGMMVSYGNSSGPVPPFSPLVLSAKGSLFLTRPTLMAYTAARGDLLASAGELFDVIRRGVVRVEVTRTWPLAEAASGAPRPRGAPDDRLMRSAAVTRSRARRPAREAS